MMNKILEFYAYEAGLMCDGVPDSWDLEAITRYTHMVIEHCCEIMLEKESEMPANLTVNYIKKVFDIEQPSEESEKDKKIKRALNKSLLALLGSEDLVNRWWVSPNKAFGGETPVSAFAKNKKDVVTYVLAAANR